MSQGAPESPERECAPESEKSPKTPLRTLCFWTLFGLFSDSSQTRSPSPSPRLLGGEFCVFGSGQEVCLCPSRPDRVRNAREQDGTRTGRDGRHLGTWMGPKHCKTKHMASLDGITSGMGPGRAQDRTQARVWMAPPRDSNRLLGLSDVCLPHWSIGASFLAILSRSDLNQTLCDSESQGTESDCKLKTLLTKERDGKTLCKFKEGVANAIRSF